MKNWYFSSCYLSIPWFSLVYLISPQPRVQHLAKTPQAILKKSFSILLRRYNWICNSYSRKSTLPSESGTVWLYVIFKIKRNIFSISHWQTWVMLVLDGCKNSHWEFPKLFYSQKGSTVELFYGLRFNNTSWIPCYSMPCMCTSVSLLLQCILCSCQFQISALIYSIILYGNILMFTHH